MSSLAGRSLQDTNGNVLAEPKSMHQMFEREGSDKSLPSSISSLGYQGDDFAIESLPKVRDGEATEDQSQDNDDDAAKMIAKLISSKPGFDRKESTFGISLLKRATIIESINWLGRHVPSCALNEISQHVVKFGDKTGEAAPMLLPHVSSYSSALLFIDMSGFTKLSQLLDVESLSKAINSYFQAIVDEVTSHGGDILKFAGDAIFAEWRAEADEESCRKEPKRRDSMSFKQAPSEKLVNKLADCVHTAALCGAAIVNKCADYPIFAKSASGAQGSQVATLNCHCGLGAGEMAGAHVGHEYTRREYLILGEPIDQVSEACDSAKLGEIRASAAAVSYLNKITGPKHQLQIEKGAKSVIIASRRQIFFNKTKKKVNGRGGRTLQPKRKRQIPFDEMDMMSLKYFHKILCSYVHPVVVSDETSYMYKPTARGDSQMAQERHRAEAELRSVFTIFIQPKIDATLTDDPAKNEVIFRQLNDVMIAVHSVLHSYRGHLRQYIVDDKGVVLIATFGLRGSTFPNMVAERALPTCRIIHSVLHEELGIESQIGGTLGKVYCGVVGGLKRHEYAVLGPSVNLSARLMSQKNHPGVMVDEAVRKKSSCMNFISFPPVKAKGYDDLVPVFKPLTAQEAKWGKVNPKFVGRKEEMGQVCKLALDMSQCGCPSKLLFVWGDSGSGKSSFIVHAIDKARKSLVTKRKRVAITRNISSEGDSLVPFSMLRSILRDILGQKSSSDESTFASKGTMSYHTKGGTLSSFSSFGTERTNVLVHLHEICEEINAPKGFSEFVGESLLGDSKKNISKIDKAIDLDLEEIIATMAQLFIRCTSYAETILLALDDVQWMDSLSWKVVQCIVENSKHILVVCGSRPKEYYTSSLQDDFFRRLNDEHSQNGTCINIHITSLAEDDIREMAAIALSCQPSELDDNFCEIVYKHSGGMPYFASEILENCVRGKKCERLDNGKLGLAVDATQNQDALQFANIEELFLSRLDSLDDTVRKTLQFAAVLGMTFVLSEILEISEHILSISEDVREEHALAIRLSLKIALEEGILDENIQDDNEFGNFSSKGSVMSNMFIGTEKEGDNDNLLSFDDSSLKDNSYTFYHDTWRRVIKSLMLDSWIQDIHMHAAMAIETRVPDNAMRDHETKVKIFQHWKGSGNTIRSAVAALDIGKSFKLLGMNRVSISVYEDAIDMWKSSESMEHENMVAGFAAEVLDSLDEENLIHLVKLQTALGQAIGSIYNGLKQKSAKVFLDTLEILRYAPASSEVEDRTFIFPIYSGLFFLHKYGALCEPSEQVAMELDLVSKFVKETERHGDPVHYGRALAMQGETCHRLGKFEDAIKSHLKLKEIYDIDKHSARVIASYASDRCAQNFGFTANCYLHLGQVDKALEICDYIEIEILPKMNPKNVHNSAANIMPALWIWRDHGQAERSLSAFRKYIKEPFDEHFGKDGSTPFLPTFKPIDVLLTLTLFMEGKLKTFDEKFFDIAMDVSNLETSTNMENALGNFGRGPNSIGAEICLILFKLTDDPERKKKLLENGVKLANLSIKGLDGSNGSPKFLTGYCQIEPIHRELMDLQEKYRGAWE